MGDTFLLFIHIISIAISSFIPSILKLKVPFQHFHWAFPVNPIGLLSISSNSEKSIPMLVPMNLGKMEITAPESIRQ